MLVSSERPVARWQGQIRQGIALPTASVAPGFALTQGTLPLIRPSLPLWEDFSIVAQTRVSWSKAGR